MWKKYLFLPFCMKLAQTRHAIWNRCVQLIVTTRPLSTILSHAAAPLYNSWAARSQMSNQIVVQEFRKKNQFLDYDSCRLVSSIFSWGGKFSWRVVDHLRCTLKHCHKFSWVFFIFLYLCGPLRVFTLERALSLRCKHRGVKIAMEQWREKSAINFASFVIWRNNQVTR